MSINWEHPLSWASPKSLLPRSADLAAFGLVPVSRTPWGSETSSKEQLEWWDSNINRSLDHFSSPYSDTILTCLLIFDSFSIVCPTLLKKRPLCWPLILNFPWLFQEGCSNFIVVQKISLDPLLSGRLTWTMSPGVAWPQNFERAGFRLTCSLLMFISLWSWFEFNSGSFMTDYECLRSWCITKSWNSELDILQREATLTVVDLWSWGWIHQAFNFTSSKVIGHRFGHLAICR